MTGRILCEASEVAAMLAGTMTQKRVPVPVKFWKVGQLRWVQEPFTEYTGKHRKDEAKYAIVYRADHDGLGIAGRPDLFRHVEYVMKVRGAEDMRMGQSRLTIEITDVAYNSGAVLITFKVHNSHIAHVMEARRAA